MSFYQQDGSFGTARSDWPSETQQEHLYTRLDEYTPEEHSYRFPSVHADDYVQKEGFLQWRDNEGAWVDVRVRLHDTVLRIAKLQPKPFQIARAPPEDIFDDVRTVTVLKRAGEPLGLHIKGGMEHRLPILISTLSKDGVLAKSNAVYIGDEILKINDIRLRNLQFNQAVDILSSVRQDTSVQITVQFFLEAGRRLNIAGYDQLVGDRDDLLGTQSQGPVMFPAPEWAECCMIPIQHCLTMPYDSEISESMLSVRSGFDAHNEAILRAVSQGSPHPEQTALEWIEAICIARNRLLPSTLVKPNPPEGFTGKVAKIGRVAERTSTDNTWRQLVLVLTDHDLSFYNNPPRTSKDLATPIKSFKLLETRYITVPRTSEDYIGKDKLMSGRFLLRFPTIMQCPLSAGLPSVEDDWRLQVNERRREAVQIIKTQTFAGFRGGEEVALVIEWRSGLWLYRDVMDDQSLIWHRTFSSLKGTTDSVRSSTLTLDFGSEGGIERIQVENPPAIVFVLLVFLETHLQAQGMENIWPIAYERMAFGDNIGGGDDHSDHDATKISMDFSNTQLFNHAENSVTDSPPRTAL